MPSDAFNRVDTMGHTAEHAVATDQSMTTGASDFAGILGVANTPDAPPVDLRVLRLSTPSDLSPEIGREQRSGDLWSFPSPALFNSRSESQAEIAEQSECRPRWLRLT